MSFVDSFPNLPTAVARHTCFLLTEALPPPLSDLPEERAARDENAVRSVAALRPADAFEARLAARAVAADAHAMDCFRSASQPGRAPDSADRCRAQAGAMMRAAESALRSLRLMQAARAKANPALAPEAVQTEPPIPPVPAEAPPCDIAAEADRYALVHPKRAALIRRLRRLPHRLDWGPTRPELVQAIIAGTSPALRALDRHRGNGRALAA